VTVDLKKNRIKAALAAHLEAASPAVSETGSAINLIAIIGISGRFPKSRNVAQFWQALEEDRALIEEIPAVRFDCGSLYSGPEIQVGRMRTRWGGFIPDIEQFDAAFFGVPPDQAALMDPQQRLLLMSVRETFEDAGYTFKDWRGSRTGVFISAERNEYYLNLLQAGVNTGDGLDQADSMIANRISHFYDLRGPSEFINAMCAGGAVALHRAVTALRSGEIDAALVGASNLLLRPDVFIKLSQSGQMSPEPTVRSFAEGANGFLRAEGVCTLLLKPLAKARADGDCIHALIRNTAVNYNGDCGASIAAPSVLSHSMLVQECYGKADIDPRDVDYIEAQGMGNPAADIAEWNALNDALTQLAHTRGVRLQEGRCAISTLKPTTGHMHAASAIGAIFKIILSIRAEKIFGVHGFSKPNPHLQITGQPCRIAIGTAQWPKRMTARLAGVHSYSAGGTNAHILIEEYRAATSDEEMPVPKKVPRRARLPLTPFDLQRYWIDTRKSPEPQSCNMTGHATPAADISSVEEARRRVRDALSKILRRPAEELDLAAEFSDFGFDSMMVRQLCRDFRDHGLPVEPAALFEHRTPARLAAWLAAPKRRVSLAVSNASAPLIGGREPIAVIGMAGIYPKAANLQEFWDNLAAGRDCTETIPAERWCAKAHFEPDRARAARTGKSYGTKGGFIANLHQFDPMFFSLSLAEAIYMHPKERLFMQIAWNAIEDAGYTVKRLENERVGVFVGVSKAGYDNYKDSFFSVANRVSYRFGFTGPSLAIDTACSSSLTAVHEACLHLQADECAIAVVGAVNAYTHPSTFAEFSRLGVMSSDGKSRAFGANADGFVPGEGGGVFLLRPLSQALARGDPIHGVIAGTAVNHGGKVNGYTVPNPDAHRELIRLALNRAGVNADDVSYVEAHGTGTALGDPIELRGLTEAFKEDTNRTGYCLLGSVKTNIGHLEAAAGVAGLTKILLQMRYGQVVPSLHSEILNPDVAIEHSPFRVPQHVEAWNVPPSQSPHHGSAKIACLSSFGAGGANAHIVLREPPPRPEPVPSSAGEHLVLLSARHELALQRIARAMMAHLERHPELPICDVAYTLQVGRQPMEWRLSCVVRSIDELIAALRRYCLGEAGAVKIAAVAKSERPPLVGADETGLTLLMTWYRQSKFEALAQLWRAGEDIDFERVATPGAGRRVSLPGYAFDQEEIAPAPMLAPASTLAPQGALAVPVNPVVATTLIALPGWVVAEPDVGLPVEAGSSRVILCGWEGEPLSREWLYLAKTESGVDAYAAYVEGVCAELRRLMTAAGHGVTFVQVVVPTRDASWLAGLSGLLKSAQLESSKIVTQLIELPSSFSSTAIRNALAHAGLRRTHAWLCFDDNGCRARGWPDISLLAGEGASCWRPGGVYLLTGGMGGLARIFARDIASRTGDAAIVLAGRSAPDAATELRLRELRAFGVQATYQQTDIADAEATRRLIAEIETRHHALNGVLHCAGELRDMFLRNQRSDQISAVLAAKVAGTFNLDQATCDSALEMFVLFSSAAAALGHPGQAVYAAANGFMDGFAEQRQAQVRSGSRKGKTVSIAWGLWRDGGMQLDARVGAMLATASGMTPLANEHGIAAFHEIMAKHAAHALVIDGDIERLRRTLQVQRHIDSAPAPASMRNEVRQLVAEALGIALEEIQADLEYEACGLDQAAFNCVIEALNGRHGWDLSPLLYRETQSIEALLSRLPETPDRPQLQPPHHAGESIVMLAETAAEHGIGLLKEVLSKAVSWPISRLDQDEPFERYGLDSMMVMQMTADLENVFGPLPKTLFYEYLSLREFNEYLCRHHRARLDDLSGRAAALASCSHAARQQVNVASARAPEPSDAGSFEIAIIGLAGRYPNARDLDEFWDVLREGRNCISEIPPGRWDHGQYYSADDEERGKTYAKWGGFIDGVDEFDPGFFNISPREALLMEPQERLFLQTAHEAIEDAGYTRQALAANCVLDGVEGAVGVFVGVTYEEYQLYAAEQTAKGEPTVLSMSPSSIANRVSFFNNFHGPSMAVDTMCASSLTTVHLACQSLRNGECAAAIAGGVNVSIHPAKFLMLGINKFASKRGQCESFGAGAGGYVPSEGVGAVLLKPLKQAMSDNDRIYGVIQGSAINHGGRTQGYSVPNPKAQAAAISQALRISGVNPEQISYLEAHGAGTALGDPIEIAGLVNAWRHHTQARQFCALGSVKSNIGHCESAAGIAGLTKVLLQMRYRQLVPTLHAEVLNPKIDFEASPFRVQRALEPWSCPGGADTRVAAVSSFGAGGSNAHIILREPPKRRRHSPASSPAAVVLSARSRQALLRYAQRLNDWLARAATGDVDIRALAYTLQVGREAWEWRLGMVVRDVAQLREGLAAFISHKAAPSTWTGELPDTISLSARLDEQMRRALERMVADEDIAGLVQHWVRGYPVDWAVLYLGMRPDRMALPTYPFERQRYWAPNTTALAYPARSGKIRLRPLENQTAAPEEPDLGIVWNGPVPVENGGSVSTIESQATKRPAGDVISPILAATLAKLLLIDVADLRPDKSYFDMGLDSVVGVQWLRMLDREHGIVLTMDTVYANPTLRQLTLFLASKSMQTATSVTGVADKTVLNSSVETPAAAQMNETVEFLRRSLAQALSAEPEQIRNRGRLLDLGLDSVIAAQWIRTINRHFQINIAADSVYTCPTFETFAEFVADQRTRSDVTDRPIVRVEKSVAVAAARATASHREIEHFLKETLATILFLDVAQLRPGARLLDLGMDSVTGAQLVREINRRYRTDLSVDAVYACSTVQLLAERVQKSLDMPEGRSLEELLLLVQNKSLGVAEAEEFIEIALGREGKHPVAGGGR
jgi:polyketide synthase PksL